MELYSKYHHLIESTTLAGIWEYDYTTNTMSWSEFIYVIFGCAKDYEPTLEENSSFFISSSLEKLTQSIHFLEKYQRHFTGMFDIRNTSGQVRTLEISMKGEFEDDKIIKRYGIIRDITEQHKQTIESDFFKERVELALQASATGTWDYHVTDDQLYWDESMLSIFDLASMQKVTRFKHWIELIHPEDREEFVNQFNTGSKGLAENNTILVTCRTLSPLGRISFVRINAKFYIDESNRNLRILGTCVDTTESEITQREIVNQATIAQQNMIKAQDATATRTRFLANMSHEIRTPMNAIMGALQILQSFDLDPESVSLTDMALESSEELLKIINDILDLSKIDAHQMGIESIGIHLGDLLSTALDKFMLSLYKDIDINLVIPPEFNPYRVGDPVRFNQIINNLISNAIKFTHEGSVTVTLRGDADNIELSVKDTGIGIPKTKLQTIFEPFKQADDSTTRSYGGTGLGLAICASLTELMKGQLQVTSKEGVGTEFTFQAPMPITAISEMNKPTEENIAPPDMTGLNIIIAEDNESNQTIIEYILNSNHANIQMCDNGEQALEAFYQMNDVDLLILDIHMPVMNGIDVCKAVRKENATVPILALTADVILQDKHVFLEHGFNDIVTKPLKLQHLYQFIRTHCRTN